MKYEWFLAEPNEDMNIFENEFKIYRYSFINTEICENENIIFYNCAYAKFL